MLSSVEDFSTLLCKMYFHVTLSYFFWLLQALKINNYDAEPVLRACGVSINSSFTQVEGRVLQPPKVYL